MVKLLFTLDAYEKEALIGVLTKIHKILCTIETVLLRDKI